MQRFGVGVAAFLQVERHGRVLWITLDRPEQMNALCRPLMTELGAAITAAEADVAVHVVMITGAGRAFCAGADLTEAKAALNDPAQFRQGLMVWRDAFAAMARCSKPVIAAVNGVALAGGLELALACDLIVASSDAKLGDVHARYGLVPGGGGSQRLPDAVGTRWARWLMYTGETLSAEDALRIGLVQAIYASADFAGSVQKLGDAMGERSGPGLAFMKRLSTPARVSDSGLDLEIEAAVHLVSAPDAREGLAAFEAKREPRFSAGPGGR